MHNDKIIQDDIQKITASIRIYSRSLSGKTIVVTGGLGFIGKYITGTFIYLNDHVLKKPCKLIIIDNHITSLKNNAELFSDKKNITYLEHDVARPIKLHGKIDYIIHAAGIASPFHYQKYPLETVDVAVNGTRNMLDLAKTKRVKSILFFSSSEIYGDPQPNAIPTKETYFGNVSSIGPRSCYDESKRLGEALCMIYHNYFKTPVKIVRPFNIFGPGMVPHDFRVIPRFIYSVLHDEPIPVHGDGKQTRTFCYISDAIAGFLRVLLIGKNGEVYNVGSNQKEISINRLAKIFNKVFDNRLKVKNIPYPKNYPQGEPKRRCPDVSKIKKELGYRPRVGLEKGLVRTFAWCKENWEV